MSSRPANRLAQQTSPYLLQHAHNPVDWYPWGADAFERARHASKPIFLSVGYSTCYWCHVMERQSFENDAIAAIMNEHFVNVKVDREERPDVDQLYMTAVQVMTQQGGWPMSVWLTPDLRPFYGGTYFPPDDAHGRPGFPRVLEALADAWVNRRDEVERSADELARILVELSSDRDQKDAGAIPDLAEIDRLVLQSCEDYDPRFGGFGAAPKFPRQTLLRLLLTWIESKPADDADRTRVAKMLRHTLDAMANGGIRDHLGGGFHRYSTDARWLVPHFEIMLYDQAMLAPIYARAARILEEPRFARVARGICDFVLREMTTEENAFHTAFDAEVDAREGLNYLWTPAQVEAVLGAKDVDRFNAVYGLDRGFNFADPHHNDGAPDANVLFLPDGPSSEDDPAIVAMRSQLLAARALRPQPLRDTKIITSWNAMMVEALATCSVELNEPAYRDAAVRAADFLLSRHRRGDGSLFRTSRDGIVRGDGFLDDSAQLAVALQELATATSDRRWSLEADRVLDAMVARFGPETAHAGQAGGTPSIDRDEGKGPAPSAAGIDPGGPDAQSFAPTTGAFFFTAFNTPDLIVRQKTATDSPLPSGNASAALAMLRSGRVESARAIIASFAGLVRRHPGGTSALLEAALLLQQHGDAWAHTNVVVGLGWTSPDQPLQEQVVSLAAKRVGARRVEVRVFVAPGYHLYDTNTDATLGLTATRLRVAPAWAEHLEFIDYPPARKLDLDFGPPVRGYDGTIEIALRFGRDLPPKEKIELSLSYQACDDRRCLLPSVARCFA